MTKIAFLFAPLSTVLVCLLPTAPAQAVGVARTFLSAAGSDSNNCANVLTPCRHLATAYAATAPNGEIYVLDPANYGSLTITGPVSIEGHGWASIAPPGGGIAAITINANSGDKINIVGVVLDGTAIASTNGIVFNSGGSLTVRDSIIRNFTGDAIHYVPNVSNANQLYVSNTLISDNATAIEISPSGSGDTKAVLNHVEAANGAANGIFASAGGQNVTVAVNDCVVANNAANGINAAANTGVLHVVVRNSMIANNGFSGLTETGAAGTIFVTRSTIMGNGSGWTGTVTSYDDNNIDSNGSLNTAPPSPLPYK